jgi:hypothetical protein
LVDKGSSESNSEKTSWGVRILIWLLPVIGTVVVVGFVLDLIFLRTLKGFNGATGAEVALVIATGALAYAAALQAATAIDSGRLESLWRARRLEDRRKDREPHLEIYGKTKLIDKVVSKPAPPDATETILFEANTLILRNNGPGTAWHFTAKRTVRYSPEEVLMAALSDPPEDGVSLRDFSDQRAQDRRIERSYLRPGEEVEVESPDEWPRLYDSDDDDYAVTWEVECDDLDGIAGPKARGSLRRSEPPSDKENPSAIIELDRDYYRSRSRWEFLVDLPPLVSRRRSRGRSVDDTELGGTEVEKQP